jgi:hypothetical protein
MLTVMVQDRWSIVAGIVLSVLTLVLVMVVVFLEWVSDSWGQAAVPRVDSNQYRPEGHAIHLG